MVGVDKQSNESPSRVNMRSLMDHSSIIDSSKKKNGKIMNSSAKRGFQESNGGGNLKLTGKSIIEGPSNN